MNPIDPWDAFDRIYCISIDDRHDRRQRAGQQFASVGLEGRVEFVIVRRHRSNRVQGIYESHRSCLARGLSAGARTMLVFEDDVVFRRFDPDRLTEACGALAGQEGWILFLGCLSSGMRNTACRALARIRYRCLAHAYALDASLAGKLADRPWSGIPFDEMLRRCDARFYALSPMCAFQGPAVTDNQTVFIDRVRRLCGGLPLIQRVNEGFHRHRSLVIALHGVALALLAYLLW